MSEPKNTPAPSPVAPEDAAFASVASNAGPTAGPESDLTKLRQERDEYLGLLQRTKADFDNYQKRILRDLAQERRYAHEPLTRDLMPVLDNLDRALTAAKQANDNGALAQGVAMVQAQVLDVLKRHGITKVEALDKPFDPNCHEAVMQQPCPDKAANTVLQVLENGFMIHERVLRPARVIVSTNAD